MIWYGRYDVFRKTFFLPLEHKYNYVGMQDLGSVLLAQLAALRDEQPAVLSFLVFGI